MVLENDKLENELVDLMKDIVEKGGYIYCKRDGTEYVKDKGALLNKVKRLKKLLDAYQFNKEIE